MSFPRIILVRQDIPAPRLANPAQAVREALDGLGIAGKVRPGQRVAITAGSRGVRDMAVAIREIARFVRERGAEPFVAPAMGSHGGATAEGQREVLTALGITEASVGAPIISHMEVDEIGRTRFGTPVLVGRDFTGADHVVVVNRVKPHTDFRGDIESGLAKIMMIGMGKRAGAAVSHCLTMTHGFGPVVEETTAIMRAKLPILCGVALAENHFDETAVAEAWLPADFIAKERKLLVRARELMGRVPFQKVDALIVDEMGKNISGTGMDTNVIGRIYHQATPEPPERQFKRIYIRDLTEAAHGNALGMGLADYTSARLVAKIDFKMTRINCVTGTTPEKGRMPLVYDRDDEAVADALGNAGVLEPAQGRLVWIKNTLELEYMWVSEALWMADGPSFPGLKPLTAPLPLPFDSAGLLPFGTFRDPA